MSARNEIDVVIYGAPLQHPYLHLGLVLAGSKFGLSSGKDLGGVIGIYRISCRTIRLAVAVSQGLSWHLDLGFESCPLKIRGRSAEL
jgi:hypothetical protein